MKRVRQVLTGLVVVALISLTPSAWRWLKRAVGVMVAFGLVACGPAHVQTDTAAGTAHLVLHVSPKMHLAPIEVFIVAELVGGDPLEALYCPNVVWTWPDTTESSEEGDCPPWDRREDFPRFWRPGRRIMVGQGTTGHFPFGVRLEKPAGHVLMTAPGGDFWAPGDVGGMTTAGLSVVPVVVTR